MIKGNLDYTNLSVRLGVIAAFLCAITSCTPITDSPDNNADLSADDAKARIDDNGKLHPEDPVYNDIFDDSPAGKILEKHLIVLATPAETLEVADARYAQSLTLLQEDKSASVTALIKAYETIDAERYFDRWAIVKTLSDLESPVGYGVLARIANSKLLADKYEDTHHFSTVEDEIMIQIRAVEGLSLLANGGHERANQDLVKLATGKGEINSAVQRRAIKAYLNTGADYDWRVKKLLEILPQDKHDLVTLKTTEQSVFHDRVQKLATIADEDTLSDYAEENLPSEESPSISSKGVKLQ